MLSQWLISCLEHNTKICTKYSYWSLICQQCLKQKACLTHWQYLCACLPHCTVIQSWSVWIHFNLQTCFYSFDAQIYNSHSTILGLILPTCMLILVFLLDELIFLSHAGLKFLPARCQLRFKKQYCLPCICIFFFAYIHNIVYQLSTHLS